ncbi:MAG: orotidine-5'-phosphate decarboxylase, partial [Chloroflexota bacterium]|nr:orotidine-5'-phosphate decarboxylase [Chloroflexota bacterium]
VLYVTRVQQERVEDASQYETVKNAYVISAESLKKAKDQMIVMHHLPRVGEIAMEVDQDPRAAYFRQMEYGLYIRMALLAMVLGKALSEMVNATFSQRLDERARAIDSLLCVGLVPHPSLLTAPTAGAARDFCLRLIQATSDLALAFKPNSAFFEVFGPDGMAALREVIAAVPAGIPVILDAKRGDIGDTSEAYAKAAFETLGAQAITVSPYLGEDSVEPFLSDPARGAFVLCKTSNPDANEFQSLPVQALQLYEQVAVRVQAWDKRGNVGLVVGATDPAALKRVRALAPDLWFLSPGVGAQGGGLEEALEAGLRPDGLGMLVTVSRSLARAADPRAEARRLVDAIRQAQRDRMSRPAVPAVISELAGLLLEAGCVRFGDF